MKSENQNGKSSEKLTKTKHILEDSIQHHQKHIEILQDSINKNISKIETKQLKLDAINSILNQREKILAGKLILIIHGEKYIRAKIKHEKEYVWYHLGTVRALSQKSNEELKEIAKTKHLNKFNF